MPNTGKITQIIGAVLDIKFADGNLPEINDAIRITRKDGSTLVVEVAQHLGDDTVRCIAMGTTDGLKRGMDAVATGAPISVPVGENTLGRIFNVLGNPIDNKPAPEGVSYEPIHRPAPEFVEQSTQQELLVGVSAYDAEDGDLSTDIIIEKMSNIIKGNRREITYVVCDSDNNVTKVAKEITYTDYKKPVIKPVSDVPVIKERKYADILACFKATDVIDGDISSKIRIDSIDTSRDSINRGVFPVTLSVTNSCGDIAYLESTVTLVE